MNMKSFKIYTYKGLGNLLEFAESQGWFEPDVDLERVDAADCIEADAIDYLTEKGWEISLDLPQKDK